jgi:hypothetical protein
MHASSHISAQLQGASLGADDFLPIFIFIIKETVCVCIMLMS